MRIRCRLCGTVLETSDPDTAIAFSDDHWDTHTRVEHDALRAVLGMCMARRDAYSHDRPHVCELEEPPGAEFHAHRCSCGYMWFDEVTA